MMRPKLIITDLDNTLYDWVTFFAASFGAMLASLERLTQVPRSRLEAEFKAIHQRYGNSEQPYALLELPSLIDAAGTSDRTLLAQFAAEPLRVFNETRRATLRLYPGVAAALERFDRLQIPVVAHTEAMVLNSFYRLVVLEIDQHFRHLYCLEGRVTAHPYPERARRLTPRPGFVREFPATERKPSPDVIFDLCRSEGVSPSDCIYVGDSVARDVAMAREAGAIAVWARYGTRYDPDHWRQLVAVTHWTDEDVAREAALQSRAKAVRPDFVVDSLDELCQVVHELDALKPT